jgi:hypothetical protein
MAHRMLGKEPPRIDVRTLMLARYVDTARLPQPPSTLDLTEHVGEWPMYENDRLGDCTCAAAGHMIEAWTGEATGEAVEVPVAAIITAYDDVKIGTGPEAGAVELDVLNYWRRSGVGGHQISGFAQVSTYDRGLVRAAAWLFGGLYIGVQLPLSAQGATSWEWSGSLSGDDAPGSWGGHAVDVVAYDDEGLTVVSWGALLRASWDFWDHYCDEAYAVLAPDYFNGRETPAGFDLATLEADLKLVTS